MRAADVTELGPASAITVGELPVPTVGPTDVLVAVEAVAVGGRIVMTAAMDGDTTLPSRDVYTRHVSIVGFVISRASVGDLAAAAAAINRRMAIGGLRPRIAHRLHLNDTRMTHELIEATGGQRVRGRIVIAVS